jgi:hypothetical protein
MRTLGANGARAERSMRMKKTNVDAVVATHDSIGLEVT